MRMHCLNCGSPQHTAFSCHFPPTYCGQCGGSGHVPLFCQGRRQDDDGLRSGDTVAMPETSTESYTCQQFIRGQKSLGAQQPLGQQLIESQQPFGAQQPHLDIQLSFGGQQAFGYQKTLETQQALDHRLPVGQHGGSEFPVDGFTTGGQLGFAFWQGLDLGIIVTRAIQQHQLLKSYIHRENEEVICHVSNPNRFERANVSQRLLGQSGFTGQQSGPLQQPDPIERQCVAQGQFPVQQPVPTPQLGPANVTASDNTNPTPGASVSPLVSSYDTQLAATGPTIGKVLRRGPRGVRRTYPSTERHVALQDRMQSNRQSNQALVLDTEDSPKERVLHRATRDSIQQGKQGLGKKKGKQRQRLLQLPLPGNRGQRRRARDAATATLVAGGDNTSALDAATLAVGSDPNAGNIAAQTLTHMGIDIPTDLLSGDLSSLGNGTGTALMTEALGGMAFGTGANNVPVNEIGSERPRFIRAASEEPEERNESAGKGDRVTKSRELGGLYVESGEGTIREDAEVQAKKTHDFWMTTWASKTDAWTVVKRESED